MSWATVDPKDGIFKWWRWEPPNLHEFDAKGSNRMERATHKEILKLVRRW